MTDRIGAWVAAYERAWRTPGTEGLAQIFAADISYRPSPWREPIVGLPALQAFWESERDGPDEVFALQGGTIAQNGDVAVIRIEVAYATGSRWRDLWVVTLDAAGRCRAFEEWPFSPEQPDGH